MGNCLTMLKNKTKSAIDTDKDGTISAEEAIAAGQTIVDAGKKGAELLGKVGVELPGAQPEHEETTHKKHKKKR